MKHEAGRIGVAIPRAGASKWQGMMLEALGARGVAVKWDGPAPPHVPMPWRGLLEVERLLARPGTDLFARTGIQAASIDAVRPGMLVLPPGCQAPPELLSRLPLGALEFDALDPATVSGGALEGRMVWRRAGLAPRLACSTATCVQGPFPLGWAGPHLAKAALMPARLLARLDLQGEAVWDGLPEAGPTRGSFAPGAADWARFLAGLAGFGLKRAWLDLLHRRQWYLAVRPGDGDPRRAGFADEPFAPVIPPRGTGWADPFPFARDGRSWLFIEEIPGRGKGVISVMEMLPGGGFGAPRRVLEEPFHLSYPNVFEHEGRTYMVPETAQAGQVRLYRSEHFPGGWVLDRVLLDGVPGTDATFLEHGGEWWMFVNVRAPGGSSWDELHLYRSASRLGPYEPHPLNPVVSDVRRARPAGPVAVRDGRLFRPAQDSSGWYGRALAVMEITRLDRTGYEEVEAARLEPDLVPGSFCLHTLVAGGMLEIVDGQRFVPVWR